MYLISFWLFVITIKPEAESKYGDLFTLSRIILLKCMDCVCRHMSAYADVSELIPTKNFLSDNEHSLHFPTVLTKFSALW